jgi:DNA-binding TFAR19-related protein (PDSD5 family)
MPCLTLGLSDRRGFFSLNDYQFVRQQILQRMALSGILRRVALVRTDVSEELSAPIIRVARIGELGTLAVTSN